MAQKSASGLREYSEEDNEYIASSSAVKAFISDAFNFILCSLQASSSTLAPVAVHD
jgi:hypothetical protein